MDTKILFPIFILSCCIGITLIGVLLGLYIYHYTKKVLYLSIAIIGFIGLISISCEISVIIFGSLNIRTFGVQFHRAEAVAFSFYLFALPLIFQYLLELNFTLKKINRIIYTTGFAAAVFFMFSAFLTPELFLSLKSINSLTQSSWNTGRGTPGILFRVRDTLLVLISFYGLALLFYELRFSKHRSFINLIITGLTVGILSGVGDIIMNILETGSGMHSYRYFSFIIPGLTFFTFCTMLAVIMLFIEQSEAIEKIKKNEFMELIAGGVAHDFNNLLTGILGNASLALFNLEKNENTRELLLSIQKAAERGRGLSRQLLDFSRGGIVIRGAASIDKLITENISFVMSGSGIDTVFQFQQDLWNVNVDETQISQVIQNLAINAKQAMGNRGKLKVTCRNVSIPVSFSILKPGRYVRIEIKDTGPGIPERDLKNIFDPYFTTKKAGTGLGLATTLSIIKNHNGHIEAESKTGNGASFIIHLPAADIKIEEETKEPAVLKKFTGRALIMDDDELILGMGARMLVELGFEAECVTCGEDAVDEYKKSMDENKPYRIVIMDLTIVGGMGGKDAVLLIKKIDPFSKVIISTGYAQELTNSDFKAMGFDGAIAKPYTFEEMKKCIEDIL